MIARFPWLIDFILLLVAFAWGTTYAGAKAVLSTQSIGTFLALRFGIAAIFSIALVGGKLRQISTRALYRGFCLGILLALSIAIESYGITLTTPSHAGVLISLTIIFVPLLESFSDASVPLGRFIPAAILSVAGCALLTANDSLAFNPGDLLILVAALTRALHLIVSRRFGSDGRESAAALTALQFGVVAVTALAFALSSGRFTGDLMHTSLNTWALIFYMALFCTVFAFFVQLKVLRYRTASHVGLLLSTEPVFAAVLGVLLGAGALSPRGWMGAGLIVVATQWGRRTLTAPRSGRLAEDPHRLGAQLQLGRANQLR